MLEVASARPLSRSIERLPSLEDLGHTFLNFASPSITPDSPTTLIPKSATTTSVISEPYYPSHSDDDDILALNSFSFSLVLGDSTSVDDPEFNMSESIMDASPPQPFSVTLQPSSSSSSSSSSSRLLTGLSGLGISGLTRKDGSGPFDGLGIVSIESSSWRHDLERAGGIEVSDSIQRFLGRHPSSSSSSSSSSFAYHGSGDEDCDQPFKVVGGGGGASDNISDIFLQETFLTFTDDPFHALCHSSSSSSILPDCGNSWSELSLEDESTSASTSDSDSFKPEEEEEEEVVVVGTKSPSTHESPPPMVSNYYRRRTANFNTNFSSPTISSELKRSTTPKMTLRNRSSWPSTTGAIEATSATPLPRRKWRL